MSPGKMNTSLAATVDPSSIASISSTTDTDDGNQIKDETKSDSTENVNIRKSMNGTDVIVAAIGNGVSADRNENAFRSKANEERIKQEVSGHSIPSINLSRI